MCVFSISSVPSIPAWFVRCIEMGVVADRSVSRISRRIRVRGLVQGVGFRPTVWRLARSFGLTGEVANDGGGVVIEITGEARRIDEFIVALPRKCPPLARIDEITQQPLPTREYPAFRIASSGGGEIRTGVVPDAATCPACLAELADAADRRHRYPFTNCTHCGPRLSILRRIPYDRVKTINTLFFPRKR